MEGPPFTGPRSKQLCEFIPYDNEGSDEDARSPTSELYTGGWAWKQVKIGKDRTEYQYLVNVKASRPKTPDPGERIPRRHLKKLLKKWRLDLHEAAQAAQRMEESRSAISTTGSDSSYSRNGGNNWTTALPVYHWPFSFFTTRFSDECFLQGARWSSCFFIFAFSDDC
eukprot:GEMP01099898.1.p1 GENE.GEMP01099898.1~~GEMP01099898.1.p1  ORF type:complete len:168 (+),score=21.84 GEMP01099898.1:73-576(+)